MIITAHVHNGSDLIVIKSYLAIVDCVPSFRLFYVYISGLSTFVEIIGYILALSRYSVVLQASNNRTLTWSAFLWLSDITT